MGKLGRFISKSLSAVFSKSPPSAARPIGFRARNAGGNQLEQCRRIATAPLDDENTKALFAAYRSVAKSMNYDKTWKPRLDLILSVIEAGATRLDDALVQIVRRLDGNGELTPEPTGYVSFNEAIRLARHPAQFLHRAAVVEAVIKLCTPQTQSIIEMGSGWGEHLCNIWCTGGPPKASYHACEISEFGRRCALVLGALEPDFKLSANYFNYTQPEFPEIAPNQDEVVVYSVHSVEQVSTLSPDLIRTLCSLGKKVSGFHMEPIGWQMIPQADWNDFTRKHHERCISKHYNENLWPLLKQAEAEKLITIECAIPNYFGLEHNPASYIIWRKRTPS